MTTREFRARHAMGRIVRGPALVAHDGFSARYDLDRTAGIFTRPAHNLVGQSYAREIAEAKGWNRLATNSAKLVNILGGYGYRPMLASMEACVSAAVSGKLA